MPIDTNYSYILITKSNDRLGLRYVQKHMSVFLNEGESLIKDPFDGVFSEFVSSRSGGCKTDFSGIPRDGKYILEERELEGSFSYYLLYVAGSRDVDWFRDHYSTVCINEQKEPSGRLCDKITIFPIIEASTDLSDIFGLLGALGEEIRTLANKIFYEDTQGQESADASIASDKQPPEPICTFDLQHRWFSISETDLSASLEETSLELASAISRSREVLAEAEASEESIHLRALRKNLDTLKEEIVTLLAQLKDIYQYYPVGQPKDPAKQSEDEKRDEELRRLRLELIDKVIQYTGVLSKISFSELNERGLTKADSSLQSMKKGLTVLKTYVEGKLREKFNALYDKATILRPENLGKEMESITNEKEQETIAIFMDLSPFNVAQSNIRELCAHIKIIQETIRIFNFINLKDSALFVELKSFLEAVQTRFRNLLYVKELAKEEIVHVLPFSLKKLAEVEEFLKLAEYEYNKFMDEFERIDLDEHRLQQRKQDFVVGVERQNLDELEMILSTFLKGIVMQLIDRSQGLLQAITIGNLVERFNEEQKKCLYDFDAFIRCDVYLMPTKKEAESIPNGSYVAIINDDKTITDFGYIRDSKFQSSGCKKHDKLFYDVLSSTVANGQHVRLTKQQREILENNIITNSGHTPFINDLSKHLKKLMALRQSAIKTIRTVEDIFIENIRKGVRPIEGRYGAVYKGKYSNGETEYPVIIKSTPGNFIRGEVEREIMIMAPLECNYIVRLFGIMREQIASMDDEAQEDCYSLVLECMKYGSLSNVLYGKGGKEKGIALEPWQLLQMGIDISHGLVFLHKNGIIHRDISNVNVLIGEKFNAKITDFSISRRLTAGEWSISTTDQHDNARYLAPEILSPNKKGAREYCCKTDIYALGVVLWELIPQRPLQDRMRPLYYAKLDHDMRQLISHGKHLQIPEYCDSEYREIIERCMDYNPSYRPSAEWIVRKLEEYKAKIVYKQEPERESGEFRFFGNLARKEFPIEMRECLMTALVPTPQ